MILVDTSIWIQYLREGNDELKKLLIDGNVCCHPFVVGEIACGFLKNRSEVLDLLQTLPQAPTMDLEETLHFIQHHSLFGKGVGWTDINLLGSAFLFQSQLWTEDKRLKILAKNLKIDFSI